VLACPLTCWLTNETPCRACRNVSVCCQLSGKHGVMVGWVASACCTAGAVLLPQAGHIQSAFVQWHAWGAALQDTHKRADYGSCLTSSNAHGGCFCMDCTLRLYSSLPAQLLQANCMSAACSVGHAGALATAYTWFVLTSRAWRECPSLVQLPCMPSVLQAAAGDSCSCQLTLCHQHTVLTVVLGV
jgi:hypothetical protein